jgi:hypothetical protein
MAAALSCGAMIYRETFILIMKSMNFEFIREACPELANLGAFAESYARSDPASALVKVRTFAEAIHRLEAINAA